MDYEKYLTKLGVPQERHAEAIASFKQARKDAAKLVPYKFLYAFLVVPFITRKLKWEDEVLPAKWWKYDNEISINGDNSDWQLQEDGTAIRLPCPLEDTPEVRKRNYWKKGLHPRDNRSRRAWLLRNRCSRYAEQLGKPVNGVYETWGDKNLYVMHSNGIWQFREIRKVGPFALKRNIGYKINNAQWNDPIRPRNNASVVYIPFSLTSWDPK